MLLVVLAHVVSWGTTVCPSGSGNVTFSGGGLNSWTYIIFQTVAALGVICFVLITSYFICESNVLRLDRILKVWSQTAFYSVLVAALSSFFIVVPLRGIFLSFLPIYSDQYWFVTKYLGLIVLAPVLSYAVKAMSRRGFICAIIAIALISVTVSFGFPYGNVMFGGHLSIGSFLVIFFVAAYLRRFGIPAWLAENCGKIFIGFILVQILGGVALNIIHDGSTTIFGGFSVGYNALSIIPATALFVWFKEHDFGDNRFSRFLVALAPYSFAVYLIHDNQYFREILWTRIFHLPEYWGSPLWTLSALVIPAVVFLLCSGLDVLRSRLFSLIRFDRLVRKARERSITLS